VAIDIFAAGNRVRFGVTTELAEPGLRQAIKRRESEPESMHRTGEHLFMSNNDPSRGSS